MIYINYKDELMALGLPIGARVVMSGCDPYNYIKRGQSGTVCHYFDFGDGCNVGVSWDEENLGLHDCNGHCKNRHGRYVPHTSLQLKDLDFGEIETSECSIEALLITTS